MVHINSPFFCTLWAMVTVAVAVIPAGHQSPATVQLGRLASSSPVVDTFEKFKTIFNKTYATPEEEAHRREIFQQSLQYVNDNRHKGVTINRFADMSKEEFRSRYLMKSGQFSSFDASFLLPICPTPENGTEIPPTLDLRTNKMLTAIRNQGECGSCWAFTALATVESSLLASLGTNDDLSEQQLVDCVTESMGCKGGFIHTALNYIQSHGVTTEQKYPYQAEQGSCQKPQSDWKNYRIDQWCLLPNASDYSIQKILAENRTAVAVPIAINDFQAFRFYDGKSVIMIDELPSDSDQPAGHGVNIVGYGTTDDGVDYWIVRNSWGDEWGQKGYFYLAQGQNLMNINLLVHVVPYSSGTSGVILSTMVMLVSITFVMMMQR